MLCRPDGDPFGTLHGFQNQGNAGSGKLLLQNLHNGVVRLTGDALHGQFHTVGETCFRQKGFRLLNVVAVGGIVAVEPLVGIAGPVAGKTVAAGDYIGQRFPVDCVGKRLTNLLIAQDLVIDLAEQGVDIGGGDALESEVGIGFQLLDAGGGQVVGQLNVTGQKAVDLGGLVGDHADLNPIQIGKRLAVLAAAIVVGVGFQRDADALNIFRDLERAGAAGVAGQVLSALRQGGGGDHQTGIVGKVHDEG